MLGAGDSSNSWQMILMLSDCALLCSVLIDLRRCAKSIIGAAIYGPSGSSVAKIRITICKPIWLFSQRAKVILVT